MIFFVLATSIAFANQDQQNLQQNCGIKKTESFRKLDAFKGKQVLPECGQAAERAKAACENPPEDPGFKRPAEGGGAAAAVQELAEANRQTVEAYRRHGKECGAAGREVRQGGLCAQALEKRHEELHELQQRRASLIGKPELPALEAEIKQKREEAQISLDLARAGSEAFGRAEECDNIHAELYQRAIDQMLAEHVPATSADKPADGDPGLKRAAGAADRTATAALFKALDAGKAGRAVLSHLGPVACANKDGIGCAVGLTQTAIDYTVKQPWKANPWVAGVGIALTPTPTAGCQASYYHSPVGAAWNGCGYNTFSAQSVDSTIQILSEK